MKTATTKHDFDLKDYGASRSEVILADLHPLCLPSGVIFVTCTRAPYDLGMDLDGFDSDCSGWI